MKSVFKLPFVFAASLFAIACEDENESLAPITVQFSAIQQIASENGGEKTVTLSLTKPATTEGFLQLKFNSDLSKYLVTNPAAQNGVITLPIHKNDVVLQFSITPVNNSQNEGNKVVGFIINGASDGFQAGSQNAFTFTIQDDEAPENAKDSYASFIVSNVELSENYGQSYQLKIQVSENSTADGSIVLSATSEDAVYGTHYITQPAFVNNELTLTAVHGSPVLTFDVILLDNNVISGNHAITFAIKSTTGNIKKGASLEDVFRITDDELKGMPMGYDVSAGSWGSRKTYEYNADGNIARVHWSKYTPYLSTGTDTYFYNDQKLLTRINERPGFDRLFSYEGNRIVKEENMENGVLKRYTEYAYDDAGNVGGFRVFYLQPDGTYALGNITVLLYYLDGNLFKKLVYVPSEDPNNPSLVSTSTIESYRAEPNPYPVIEVLPNLNTQKNLPASYRHEVPGHNLLYNFTYEFRSDGKVAKRTATQGSTGETAVYHYY